MNIRRKKKCLNIKKSLGKFAKKSWFLILPLLFFSIIFFPEKQKQTVPTNLSRFPANETESNYFNRQREFPNYFLPPEYRNVESRDIPQEVIQKAREKLREAVASIFNRLTVPTMVDGEIKSILYFPFIQEEIGRISPEIEVIPSGGVVRSVIGYLYNELYQGELRGTSAEKTLEEIIDDKSPVPGIDVRGVGSDFDLLMKCPESLCKQAREIISRITNSAIDRIEGQRGRDSTTGSLRKSLFTIGDIKEYSEQISRSSSQGGSTLDFLAFDISRERFVEPPDEYRGKLGIVDKLISGLFDYIPPASESSIEDPDKQTIRGMRPLLELPFLRMSDEGQFRRELEDLLKKLEAGNLPSDKALEQFGKMSRNARFSGAHNIFFRSSPGSLEESVAEVLEKIRRIDPNIPLIPEFVDHFLLEKRNITREMKEKVPDDLFMSLDEFMEKHTDNGKLYHGTPNVDNALSILRGGFIISGGHLNQGGSSEGRGVYSSPHQPTARGYSGANGILFDLDIKKDENIRILDWEKVRNHPAMKKIMELANDNKPFEYLARNFGVDIIVNQYVLIQNGAVIKPPENISFLIRGLGSYVENTELSYRARLNYYHTYKDVYLYAVGENSADNLKKPEDLARGLIEELTYEKMKSTGNYYRLLVSYGECYSDIPSDKKTGLETPDEMAIKILKGFSDDIDNPAPEIDYQRLFDEYMGVYSHISSDSESGIEAVDDIAIKILKKLPYDHRNYSTITEALLKDIDFSSDSPARVKDYEELMDRMAKALREEIKQKKLLPRQRVDAFSVYLNLYGLKKSMSSREASQHFSDLVRGLFSGDSYYDYNVILSKVKDGSKDIVLSFFQKAFPNETGLSSWENFFYHSFYELPRGVGMNVYDMPDPEMQDSWFLAMEKFILKNPNRKKIGNDLLLYTRLYQDIIAKKTFISWKAREPFDLAREWIEEMDMDDNFLDKTNLLTAPEYDNRYFRESESSSSRAFYESLLGKIHSRIFDLSVDYDERTSLFSHYYQIARIGDIEVVSKLELLNEMYTRVPHEGLSDRGAYFLDYVFPHQAGFYKDPPGEEAVAVQNIYKKIIDELELEILSPDLSNDNEALYNRLRKLSDYFTFSKRLSRLGNQSSHRGRPIYVLHELINLFESKKIPLEGWWIYSTVLLSSRADFDKSELRVSLYQKIAKIIEKATNDLSSFHPTRLKEILEGYNRIYLALNEQNKTQTVHPEKLRGKIMDFFANPPGDYQYMDYAKRLSEEIDKIDSFDRIMNRMTTQGVCEL